MSRSKEVCGGGSHQLDIWQRQRQVLPRLLPRLRGDHGQPAGVQLGESSQGHSPPVQESRLEGRQGLQVHPGRVQGGAGAPGGRHDGRLQVPGGHAHGPGCGAQQGGRVQPQGDPLGPVEPVRPLQEEQERRVRPGGEPGVPCAASAEQVHLRGGERGRDSQKHILLHRNLPPGRGVQVGILFTIKVYIVSRLCALYITYEVVTICGNNVINFLTFPLIHGVTFVVI